MEVDKIDTLNLAASAAQSNPILFGVGISILSGVAIYSFWIQVNKVIPLKDSIDDIVDAQSANSKKIASIETDVNYMCRQMKETKEKQDSMDLLRKVVAEQNRGPGEDFIRGID